VKEKKITINLSETEAAQIDFLVSKGLYASRSDYVRLAVRNQNQAHKEDFDRFLATPDYQPPTIIPIYALGIMKLGKRKLEGYLLSSKKVRVRLIGVLTIEKDVSVQLLSDTLLDIEVYGKLIASDEVKEFLKRNFT